MPSQSEFPNNDHIINFLDYYTGLTTPPHYAVLLTGDWGIGKTFFILDYMKKVEERHAGKKSTEDEARKDDSKAIIKVSLNGVQSKDEIDNMIIRAFHPSFAKKGAGIMGKVITSAASIFNADLSNFQASDFLNVYRKETIYVFDDLERCGMPIESTLGYINSFVEQEGCKVIIIGNEKEITGNRQTSLENEKNKTDEVQETNKINNTQEDKIYKDIKEKVIGHTLKMMPETEKALDYFLDQHQHSEAKKYLKSRKELIVKIYQKSQLNNLRILQRTINDFERLNECFEEKYREKSNFMEDLITIIFPLSLEIKSGNLDCAGFQKIKDDICRRIAGYKYKQKSKEYNILDKYEDFIDGILFKKIFSSTTLLHILEYGFISKEEIMNDLNSNSYFKELKAWEKLQYGIWEKPEERYFLLQQIEDEFINRLHTDPSDIISLFKIKLWLSENEIITDNISKVMSDCKLYIEDVYTKFSELGYKNKIIINSDPDPDPILNRLEELYDFMVQKSLERLKGELINSIKEKILSQKGISQEDIYKLNSPQFSDVSILEILSVNDICNFMTNDIHEGSCLILRIIMERNYSGNLETKKNELEGVKEIKDHLIQIRENLDLKEIENRFKKLEIRNSIEYIDEKIIPVLSGNEVKPDEAVLNPAEVPCQTENPV